MRALSQRFLLEKAVVEKSVFDKILRTFYKDLQSSTSVLLGPGTCNLEHATDVFLLEGITFFPSNRFTKLIIVQHWCNIGNKE